MKAASRFDFHCCSFLLFFSFNGILTESVDNLSATLLSCRRGSNFTHLERFSRCFPRFFFFFNISYFEKWLAWADEGRIFVVCVWSGAAQEIGGREKAYLGEIADFYNLIKCKYNGCEAEHIKDKK